MRRYRHTGVFPAYAAIAVLAVLAAVLGAPLLRSDREHASRGGRLMFFCAAGMRLPIDAILAQYERECGVRVEVQYGGSNTLLSQLQISRAADVYLAADDYYAELARERDLIREVIPVASMTPVIVVPADNPKGIASIDDLLRDDVSVVLGNPDQAAIGKMTRDMLQRSGHWDALERHVTRRGVFKPTVPDVANAVKIGGVDAGVVWSATAAQYPELGVVRTPELDAGKSSITIAVTPWAADAPTAIGLARYIAASDRGLPVFGKMGYEPVAGDPWTGRPEITFFAGSVNRRALEPIVNRFEQREGVLVNTVYNGCGILTAQMRAIRKDEGPDFPDTYIACDQYYLDAVADFFDDGVQVSDTKIVLGVATVAASLLGANPITVIIGAGLIGALWFSPLTRLRGRSLLLIPPLGVIASAAGAPVALSVTRLFLVFLKVGALLFGSGYVLVAYLNRELVENLGWLTNAELLDAIAIGQFTPGPILSTSTFIGYKIAGLRGAVLATVGIFLPSFLFVLAFNRFIPKMRKSKLLAGFLDAVNVAAVGVMAAVAVTLGRNVLSEWRAWLIALAAGTVVIAFKKVGTFWIVLGGAAAGYLLRLP